MIDLRVHLVDEKHLRISGIHPYLGVLLQELPGILEQRDSAAAASRLYPQPSLTDSKLNDEWQQMVAPELRHLFVSAGQTVLQDLPGLQPQTPETGYLELTIPAEHLNAWMSALNQARLILGELFSIREQDMNAQELDLRSAKQTAVLKIQMLGYLLHLFVEFAGGGQA